MEKKGKKPLVVTGTRSHKKEKFASSSQTTSVESQTRGEGEERTWGRIGRSRQEGWGEKGRLGGGVVLPLLPGEWPASNRSRRRSDKERASRKLTRENSNKIASRSRGTTKKEDPPEMGRGRLQKEKRLGNTFHHRRGNLGREECSMATETSYMERKNPQWIRKLGPRLTASDSKRYDGRKTSTGSKRVRRASFAGGGRSPPGEVQGKID